MDWLGTIIAALLAGIIIGPLARLVLPGRQNISMGMTILIGAFGALAGWSDRILAVRASKTQRRLDWTQYLHSGGRGRRVGPRLRRRWPEGDRQRHTSDPTAPGNLSGERFRSDLFEDALHDVVVDVVVRIHRLDIVQIVQGVDQTQQLARLPFTNRDRGGGELRDVGRVDLQTRLTKGGPNLLNVARRGYDLEPPVTRRRGCPRPPSRGRPASHRPRYLSRGSSPSDERGNRPNRARRGCRRFW